MEAANLIYFQTLLGFVSFLAIAFALSENRKAVSPRLIGLGLVFQLVLALLFLKVPFLEQVLVGMNSVVILLNDVTLRASQFMFGYLSGGPTPFEVTEPGNNFVLAFQILPLIIVVSALSSLLFYWRVLPWIIGILAKILQRTFGFSAPLAFGCGATLFLGTIEAPLAVRPYLNKMERGELFALICCSMATIAGTVLVLYANVVNQVVSQATTHLLTASVMSIPAAIILAHVMIPIQSKVEPEESHSKMSPSSAKSSMEAIIQGTSDGLQMVLQITAIILVLFALIYFANDLLALLPWAGITVEGCIAYLLRPIMWLTGISWDQTAMAADLMAQKIIFNEFVAFLKMSQLSEGALTPQNKIILTYAMCGFANIASSGIVIGGLSSLIPERKKEVVSLAIRSIVVGNLATLMTASFAAMLL